jgi:tetratricopeptide (TPR) repeat protein
MRGLLITGLLLGLLGAGPARAIMSGEESPLLPSSDADYAEGKAAFLAEEWARAVAALERVVARRPWHDNAHNMLGFASRKLGLWDKAFEHYDKALELNPRHKQALEYLGEAYLEQGRIAEAQAVARRLTAVCAQVVMAFDNQGWKHGCRERDDLAQAFAEHGVPWPER